MNIKNVSISEIRPYERNPRHNDQAVEFVANSIREFGWKQPIVVDKDGVIVAGHTRFKAAKKLGLRTVPVVVADDLTEEQIKAYRLADNKTGEAAEWDLPALAVELDGIFDLDMEQFGFLDESGDEPEAREDEDFTPEPPENPRAKLGDIYQLGQHRLMCGDSTSLKDVKTLTDGDTVDLLLTDPPYGINVVEKQRVGGGNKLHFGKIGGKNWYDSRTYRAVMNDDTTDTARASYEVAKTCSENQVIFGGNYFTDFLPPSRCWIVWDKENTGNFADAELAWTSFDKGVRLYRFLWNGLVRAGSRDVEGKTRVHPTQKPVGMLAGILKDFSTEGDVILDLFGGSGSTLIACEQMERICYMMELDPHYIDVIISRWEQFTGRKAEKIN